MDATAEHGTRTIEDIRSQEWAYSADLARLFGMHRATFVRRVRAWQAKHKIPSFGKMRGLQFHVPSVLKAAAREGVKS